MTIGEKLTEQARIRPTATALIDDARGRTLTFAGLESEVGAAAEWWQAQGIHRGDAVLVFVPMSIDLYVALLGLFRIGAVALFLDPSSGLEHLERCCNRRPPRALFAVPKAHLLRLRSPALRRIPVKITPSGWLPWTRRWPRAWSGPAPAPALASPADEALLTFTSGSTGMPKGAVRTQAFLLAQYEALAPSLELEPGEVDLATLPVFVLANLAAGVTTVIPDADLRRPGAVDADAILRQIDRHHVTRLTASPAFFERILGACTASGVTLPGLRKLHTGGAPVFPRLLEALRAVAPNAAVTAVYGSTEAEPIAHLDARDITAADLAAMRSGRGLLAGRAEPQIGLRIVRDRWGEPQSYPDARAFEVDTLPAGETGEIVVTGAHVLKGYLDGRGDEETKFRVGDHVWHRTGDAGCLDAEGRVWLQGRCAARIDDTRGRLYPFGVECVAMTFPSIRRAALVAHAGQRILVVETHGNSDAAALRDAVAWAQVDAVRVIATMPVDSRHNAKIDYPRLRRWLEQAP